MSNALNPSESVVFNYDSPKRINDVRKELAEARLALEKVTLEYTAANHKVADLTRDLAKLLGS